MLTLEDFAKQTYHGVPVTVVERLLDESEFMRGYTPPKVTLFKRIRYAVANRLIWVGEAIGGYGHDNF